MPCLTSCCCGFSVKAGTRAIAILSVVYSVLGLLMVGTFNLEKDRLLERQITGWPGPTSGNPSFHGVVDPNLGNLDGHIMKEQLEYREYDIHTSLSNEELKKYEKQKRLELIMSVYAISVSVNFLVSLSLLAGVRLEKRWLLLPWMAWTTLSLIVSQMAVFYTPNKTMSTIPDIFSTGISIYCIMCVYSYFQTLSEDGGQERGRGVSSLRVTSQSTWTGAGHQATNLRTSYITASPAPLSPRSPLTVSLPPDSPPAYQSPDNPPTYDPPPPYPGSPQNIKMTLASPDKHSTSNNDDKEDSPSAQSSNSLVVENEMDKNIP